jgi:hypothetical protein
MLLLGTGSEVCSPVITILDIPIRCNRKPFPTWNMSKSFNFVHDHNMKMIMDDDFWEETIAIGLNIFAVYSELLAYEPLKYELDKFL